MKRITIKLIDIYQKVFSPDHSQWGKSVFPNGYCRYYPSCSEYARQSIEKLGLFEGILFGTWRIIRCNPFSEGGMDLVITPPAAKEGTKTARQTGPASRLLSGNS